ncbi:hypothetical protein KHHGKMAE_0157 [Methylobacterium persicinum]|nr:hypothetical protein KHHGKMAE_0157 [Methylobacterium persicinum]
MSWGVMPKREAASRSIDSVRVVPRVCWSVATSRSSGRVFILSRMRGAQVLNSARSGSWSVYSNWVRDVRPPVRTSWVAWMNVRIPSTRSSLGRSRPITWNASASRSSRGLSVMYMRPELSAWPLPPSDMPTPNTAGSAWTIAPTFS